MFYIVVGFTSGGGSVFVCSGARSLSESRAGSCSRKNCGLYHGGPERVTIAVKNILLNMDNGICDFFFFFFSMSVELNAFMEWQVCLFCIYELATKTQTHTFVISHVYLETRTDI